jgi:cytochrome c biogenesis protein CcdA
VAGAILTSDTGWLNTLVDRVAGEWGGFVGGLLPLSFAFSAGMASAFNPCGFPLLPTYLGLFLAEQDPDARARPATRLTRALAVGGAVTVGFVLLFTAVGVTIGVGTRVLVDWLPWIALGLGVALVLAGGYRLAGGSIYSALPERFGARSVREGVASEVTSCSAWPTASPHSAAPCRSSSRWSAPRSPPPPPRRPWQRSRSTG